MVEREPIVRADELRVRFGDTVALDGLTVDTPAGAVTAVLGPNGAGKTTFVRCIATRQPYDHGRLRVAGVDVQEAPPEVRHRIGLAGQHGTVEGRLTGRENLQLAGRLHGLRRVQARRSAERVIDAFELDAFADRPVDVCSGGQRRRIDLAAALVTRPQLLLLDEPTVGIDPHSRRQLWELIRCLPPSGTSVLLTTQHLDEAAVLADHVVIIDRGRVIAAGAPDELRQATGATTLTIRTKRTVTDASADEIAGALHADTRHDGDTLTLVGRFDFHDAAAALRSTALEVAEVAYRPPTLDEVFLSLTAPTSREAR